MLGLAEYIAAKNDLLRTAIKYEEKIKEEITDTTAKAEAVAIGLKYARDYRVEQRLIFQTAIQEVTRNAFHHYEKRLGMTIEDESVPDKIISAQYEERYYGATLKERLRYNDTVLAARITRSAEVDTKAVAKVWTSGVPFGAHFVSDRTLLLGTLVKIEQDVAREFAARTEHKLVRWTLSHKHKQPDVCDELANHVDSHVASYLKENRLNVSPRGLYFVDDLPVPPHPNCQCEYGVVRGGVIIGPGKLDRTLEKVKKLLRRAFRK